MKTEEPKYANDLFYRPQHPVTVAFICS